MIIFWQDRGEDAEDPVRRIHFWSQAIQLEVVMKLGKVLHNKVSNDVGMLTQTWEAILKDVPQLTLFDELNEQPEG